MRICEDFAAIGMDPSIMKLLEEDEDETMHSGADVEAFTAALNRDIEGDTSASQPSDSDSAVLSQGSNHTSSQLYQQWQTSSHDENASYQIQQDVKVSQQEDQHSSLMDLKQHESSSENQLQKIESSQELNCLPLQHKQSQDNFPQQQTEQNNPHISQTMSIQNSEKGPTVGQEPDRTQDPNSLSQYLRSQKMNNQQAGATGQASNALKNSKQVPFAMLLPVIEPLLDKDRAMQLRTLYNRLKKNEISKDGFVKHMRVLVGDHMLKVAVVRLQEKAPRSSQVGSNQVASHSQVSAQQQHMKMPAVSAKQFTDSQSFTQLHQKGLNSPVDPSRIPSSAAQVLTDPNNTTMENNALILRDIKQERERPFPIQGLNKQQQQHLHFPPTSFPTYGSTGSNYNPYAGANINSSAQSLKQQPNDSQMRQVAVHPSVGATQAMSVPKFEKQNTFSEPKRGQSGTFSHSTNHSTLQQNSVHWQSSTNKEQNNGALSSVHYVKQEPIDQANEQQQKSQLSSSQGVSSFSSVQLEQGNTVSGSLSDDSFEMQPSRMGFSASTSIVPSTSVLSSMTTHMDTSTSLSSRLASATSSMGPGSNAKTPLKRPAIGQKKPLESLGSSPPSKKQKLSLSDQSIEQLNDVTAVSGVNLREEEEQLFSGPKEDSRVSEASRRVVQEEEERLILQKVPLQKKLTEIMTKCGLKSISNDVERCLSLSVEERLRALISNLVRLSKQRVDIEKPRHRTIITSDVRQQIITMNLKAREEWDKKQGDSEKNPSVNEPEGNTGLEGDKEKDDNRARTVKVNKEEDDKMRTTAANVAARAAVGGDDMLSKWQLMAEQARQKREGGIDATSSQPGKDVSRKLVSTSVRNARDNQETDKRSQSATVSTAGAIRKFGRTQVSMSQMGVPRNVSIKDVIAVLEREPQTSKSTLIYRLYDKVRSDSVSD